MTSNYRGGAGPGVQALRLVFTLQPGRAFDRGAGFSTRHYICITL